MQSLLGNKSKLYKFILIIFLFIASINIRSSYYAKMVVFTAGSENYEGFSQAVSCSTREEFDHGLDQVLMN